MLRPYLMLRRLFAKDAIVAWHRGRPRCDGIESRPVYNADGIEILRCDEADAFADFFLKRRIDWRFTQSPQTAHTSKMVATSTAELPDKGRIYWMWHPESHKHFFGTQITYERYPKSQDEVDEIVQLLGLFVRVYYDPSR